MLIWKFPCQYLFPNWHNEKFPAITIGTFINHINFTIKLCGLLFHSNMISGWEMISKLYCLPLLCNWIFGGILKFSFYNYARYTKYFLGVSHFRIGSLPVTKLFVFLIKLFWNKRELAKTIAVEEWIMALNRNSCTCNRIYYNIRM